MSLSNDQIITLLFKKYKGFGNTQPSQRANIELNVNALPRVIPTAQIYKQTIPSSVPKYNKATATFSTITGLTIVKDLSFNDNIRILLNKALAKPGAPSSAIQDISNVFATAERYYLKEYPHIVRYQNLPTITPAGATPGQVYLSATTSSIFTDGSYRDGENLLSNTIPSGYDTKTNSFTVEVVAPDNGIGAIAVISPNSIQYPWILDTDTGFLTFYGSSKVCGSADGTTPVNNPRISFWRYEGEFGFGSGGSFNTSATDVSGGILVYDGSNVKISTDLKFMNNVLDISGSIKIGNVTIDSSGSNIYTLRLPQNLPSVNAYLRVDSSGNLSWAASDVSNSDILNSTINGGKFLGEYSYEPGYISSQDNSERIANMHDTQSNAIGKLDRWLNKYIVDTPPAPTGFTTTKSSTEIKIEWTYPTIYPIGLLNTWVPVISAVNFKLTKSDGTTLIKKTDNANIPQISGSTDYVKSNGTATNYISGVRLIKTAGTDGITNVSGKKYYTIYNVDPLSLSNDMGGTGTNKIFVWYSNNNSTAPTKQGQTTFNIFGVTGLPAKITSIGQIGNNATYINVQAIAPRPDKDDITSTVTINNVAYTYTYKSGQANRHGGEVAYIANDAKFQGNGTITGSYSNGQNITFTIDPNTSNSNDGLYPESTYTITANASNDNGTNYGTNSDNVDLTTGTVSVSAATALTSISRNTITTIGTTGVVYSSSATSASGRTIVNKSSVSEITYTVAPATLAINLSETRGTLGGTNKLLKLSTSYSDGTTTLGGFLEYGGFNVATPTADDTANGLTLVKPVSESDSYDNTTSAGYYQQVNNPLTLVKLALSGLTAASDKAYNVSIQRHKSSNGTAWTSDTAVSESGSFYLENYSGTASITSQSLTIGTLTTYQASGVTLACGNVPVSLSATANNFGGVYYKSPFLSYSGDGLNQQSITSTLSTSSYSLSAPNIATTPSQDFTIGQRSIGLTLTPLIGTDVTATATSANSIIYDRLTYNLLNNSGVYPTSIPNATFGNATRAMHIVYAADELPLPASDPDKTGYVHSTSLTSTYKALQIIRGKFRTAVNGNSSYANYTSYLPSSVNYTSLASENGYRYATFCVNIFAVGTSVNYATIKFEGLSVNSVASFPTYNVGGTDYITTGSGRTDSIKVDYRILRYNSNTYAAFGSGTTIWLDGNDKSEVATELTQSSQAQIQTYTTTAVVNQTAPLIPIIGGLVNADAGNGSVKVTLTDLGSGAGGSQPTAVLLIRVGVKMQANMEFSGISVTLS